MNASPGSHLTGRARRVICFATASAFAVSVAACGVRTDPIPPEDTAARAPGDLTVQARDSAAVLRWERPRETAGGDRLYDLHGFVVERRIGDGAYRPIATLDVTDNERIRTQRTFRWTDEKAPLGRVEYRVRAVTADGQAGEPTEPAVLDDSAQTGVSAQADDASAPDSTSAPKPQDTAADEPARPAQPAEEELGEFRPIPEPIRPEGTW